MRYHEFVERVLAILLAKNASHAWESGSFSQLAEDLGLDSALGDLAYALNDAIRDLQQEGLATSGGMNFNAASAAARPYRVRPISELYPELRERHLEPDEEAFLRSLAIRSEVQHEGWAEARRVDARDVFADMGVHGGADDLHAVWKPLKDAGYIQGLLTLGGPQRIRITWAGLIRVVDEPGEVLSEAREHLGRGRLRAAGCVAAIELERRLKALGSQPIHLKRRDPSLIDYSQAAFDAGLIDQETWTQIGAMAAIRKRCVHVLDREPSRDEVLTLIEGVDGFLRRNPAPATITLES